MPNDAYAAERVATSQHRHPYLTQADVDLAGRVTSQRSASSGRVLTISHDHRLACCGLLVSTLAPGATYADA